MEYPNTLFKRVHFQTAILVWDQRGPYPRIHVVNHHVFFNAVGTALRWPRQRVPRYTAVRPCWRRRKRWSSRGWSWFWYWKKASWTWPNGTLAFWMFCLYVCFLFFTYFFFGGVGIFTIFAGQPHPPKKKTGKQTADDNMLCMMKENTQTGGCWLGFWKGLGWW